MVSFQTTEAVSEYLFMGTIAEFEALIFDEDPFKEVLFGESAKVSNTCQQIIKEIEKIKEHMPAVEVIEDSGRRRAQIEVLRWVRPHAPYANMNISEYVSGIDEAIIRIENGGNLVE
jgi:hypothetical protein